MKIKLILLTIIFTLTFITNVYSQIDVGIIGGINIASFDADADITSKWLWGAGIVLSYKLSDNFSLQAEPMYLKKGGVQEQKGDDPKITVDQSFLEIPLLAKYNFGKETKFYLLAGPSIGYLLTSELEADLNGFLFTADMEKLTETIDIGICLGGGVSIPIETNTLFFQVEYTYGLTNLAKNGKFVAKSGHIELEGEFDEEESKYKSRGLQLLVGFTFPM